MSETGKRKRGRQPDAPPPDPETVLSRCAGCGMASRSDTFFLNYTCRYCHTFNQALWKSEHSDPEYAATMTLADIAAEYLDAGMEPPAGVHV